MILGVNGLKLDFERKIWWLPRKPQITYKIESNPKENRVKWNKEEKDREPNKDSQERRMIYPNKMNS